MINFIHVPKTAGSSFHKIIKKDYRIVYCEHVRVKDISSMSFVRHPYDRLVSAYFYLTNRDNENPLNIEYEEILKKYIDFKDFVMHIEVDDLHNKIIHLKPMHYWLCDEDGKIIVDGVFKIEDVSNINEFLVSLGYEEKLSDVHINSSKHGHITEYLDGDIIKEINKIYKLDFELFDYKML